MNKVSIRVKNGKCLLTGKGKYYILPEGYTVATLCDHLPRVFNEEGYVADVVLHNGTPAIEGLTNAGTQVFILLQEASQNVLSA